MKRGIKRSREYEARKNSIIRLLVSVLILLLVLVSIELEFSNPFASAIKGVLACVLLFWSLISIAKSSAAIRFSSEANTKIKPDANNGSAVITISSIATLLAENDIIEFDAMMGEKTIKFGTSSDLEPGGSVFFDKLYYVDNTEYVDLDNMVKALNTLFPDGEITVLLIDGLNPKYYRIP